MRPVYAVWVSLAGALLISSSAVADVHTIPLSAPGSDVVVTTSDDALHVTVEVGELRGLDVMTDAGEFTRLVIPGYHSSKIVGEPELPMMNRLFEIPYGAVTRIEVLSSQTRDIDLGTAGILHRLLPAQPSMPKSADPANWPFVYAPESYAVDKVARDLVTATALGRMRAVDIGRLEISPVEYFPDQNRIRVHERIEFRVVFEGIDHASGAALEARTRSPFFEVAYGAIAGRRGFHDGYPDRVRDVVTMVVVTPPMFEDQLQEFVGWKTKRGFHTILAVTGTPEVGSTKEQIQSYIHDLYNNPAPGLQAPSFVIFVGDVAQMPTWFLSGDATDRPYCDVEGDLVPDIYYGRLSATNPSQLDAILEKTLMYDQFTMPDPSYLGEVVMIAGMDSGHGSTWGNGQINYGTTYYFNAAHDILSHTYLYPASGSNASNIIQNVSDGVGYINYTAHGSITSWSDPYFGQSDINGLQNYGEYCMAVGNCCLTSTYDSGECFAETWLRAPDKGAIGYIGGSNSTYWDEDYWWGVGYGSIVPNPLYEETEMGAYDGLFHDHGEDPAQWYVTNDAILFSGNLAVMEAGSSLTTYYWNIYNLMGDPSLCTYLGVPGTNPVIHPPTLYTTNVSLPISAAPQSYVGLTQNGQIVAAGTVGSSGTVDLAFVGTLIPGTAELVCTAQNCAPYQTTIPVVIPATVIILPEVIDAGTPTTVTVGVFEPDGVTPKPGIEVWAEGLNYVTTPVITGSDGYCSFMVDYPYGPSIDVVGKDPVDEWNLFVEPVEVDAIPLGGVTLVVTNVAGISDFALNLPNSLIASPFGGELPLGELWAFLNDEPGVGTSETELVFTPDALGTVGCYFAAMGYDLVFRSFDVAEVYGTLSGHVDADGSPGNGALVRGRDDQGEEIFQAVADGFGNYSVAGDIVVDTYTVTAELFGFLTEELAYFVDYGTNALDFDLGPAPSGVMTGTVTELDTGLPLDATVSVYRNDTMDLYNEVTTDPGNGLYTTDLLPYFSYMVIVNAFEHAPDTALVVVDAETLVMDFELERVYELSFCHSPALSIPDDNPVGVSDAIAWPFSARVDGVRVFVDITHTYQGDLIVELTSPEGTVVRLHDRTGGSDNDIYGWYPDDLEPAESLDAFLGEDAAGDWTLHVSDNAGIDTGTLNEWCLWVAYGEVVDVISPAALPAVLALRPNVPNPFNPTTRLRFDLPRSGSVSLTIFDIQGRRVRTLVDGQMDAGRHQITWHGRDDVGRRVSSGVYFYRLNTEGRTLTRQMTILK